LFDSSKGSIGLAWNIFTIRGTPTADSWPTFLTLPDAGKVNFVSIEPVSLGSRLPNLPTTETNSTNSSHFPPTNPETTPLDLVHRFLVYPPDQRLSAFAALHHPWFSRDGEFPLLLPAEYPNGVVTHSATSAWEGRTLPDLLRIFLST